MSGSIQFVATFVSGPVSMPHDFPPKGELREDALQEYTTSRRKALYEASSSVGHRAKENNAKKQARAEFKKQSFAQQWH